MPSQTSRGLQVVAIESEIKQLPVVEPHQDLMVCWRAPKLTSDTRDNP